jgi:ABC-2 type transport system ATP-binding protein
MSNECLATLSGVTHRYGDVVALDRFDLDIRPGEVLAVLGPNGAGKTTAIGLLLGNLSVQQGAARVFGRDPGAGQVRMRRGAMLQVSGVADTLTVAEHLELFSGYYPAPLPVSRLLAMAGLEDLGERRYGRLSGGQQQRVMFALALAGDPELVFLDEPTTGLDVKARRSLWNEIRRLKAAGRTAVLTTHYLEEADALADRVVVIHRGRVVAEGTPAEIKSRTADRRVRCITTVDRDAVAALPGVVRVEVNGQHLEILTARPEDLLRTLLARDPDLRDLQVTGAGLDDAFLTLVGDGGAGEVA